MDFNNCIDFRLDLNVNREIRVLQITDTQPVDISQQRFAGRLGDISVNAVFTYEMKYKNEFYYIDKAIKDNNPDLIIVTGDIIYGEFDDNGSDLIEFIEFMESYGIFWAPVFGNHDNESKKGVAWQCQQFLNAKHCLFKRNTVTGNGNYNIGIFNNDKLVRVIYMMDSNGVYNGKEYGYLENYPPFNQDEKTEKYSGIYNDQREYIANTSKEIDNINGSMVHKTMCCHIAPDFLNIYAKRKGYQTTDDPTNKDLFDLGGDKLIDNKDFGEKKETVGCFNASNLHKLLKELGFDTMFIGHDHINTYSMDCDGIRVSYGIKTSTFDYTNKVGSLLFSILDNGQYGIEHKFIDKLL